MAVLGLAVLASGGQAGAAETPFARTQGAEVRLLAGEVRGGVLEAGIEIRLDPGWKTYWRYPGDSGTPPHLEWDGSRNLAPSDAVQVLFPAPQRFSDGGGGFSIGYKGRVLLPVRVALADAAKSTHLNLALDFAVCEALCVPAHVRLALEVPPGGGGPVPVLAAAQAAVPVPVALGAPGPLGVDSVRVDTGQTPPMVVVTVRGGPDADLFVEGPDDAWALPLPEREGAAGTFRFPIDGLPANATWHNARIRLTLTQGDKAVQAEAVLTPP